MFESLMAFFGCQTIIINPQDYSYKLGKQCKICKQNILHRESISVCQCYLFAHKKCFVKTITQLHLSQFSKIACLKCNNYLRINLINEYIFQPAFTLKKIGISFLLLIFLLASCAVLFRIESDKTQKQRQSISSEEIGIIFITVIFSILFWISIMRILFKKSLLVQQIQSTNIDIKISAFESIQEQIKQDSQQQILIKAVL